MLNIQLIKDINKILCVESNEPHAILNNNSLEAIMNFDQFVFGQELYPLAQDKISFITVSLIKNHCFANGNKRTASVILIMLADENGLNIPNDDKLFDIILETATQPFDVQQFKNKIFKGNS